METCCLYHSALSLSRTGEGIFRSTCFDQKPKNNVTARNENNTANLFVGKEGWVSVGLLELPLALLNQPFPLTTRGRDRNK